MPPQPHVCGPRRILLDRAMLWMSVVRHRPELCRRLGALEGRAN